VGHSCDSNSAAGPLTSMVWVLGISDISTISVLSSIFSQTKTKIRTKQTKKQNKQANKVSSVSLSFFLFSSLLFSSLLFSSLLFSVSLLPPSVPCFLPSVLHFLKTSISHVALTGLRLTTHIRGWCLNSESSQTLAQCFTPCENSQEVLGSHLTGQS